MKQMMTDMMILAMPAMVPLVYIGAGLIALGILTGIIALVSGSGGGLVRLSSIALIALGIFFLGCQAAGMWLEMAPSINFGDPTKFEFFLYPFWMIGGAMLLAGIVIKILGSIGAKRAT